MMGFVFKLGGGSHRGIGFDGGVFEKDRRMGGGAHLPIMGTPLDE